jgi:hypothetical protein
VTPRPVLSPTAHTAVLTILTGALLVLLVCVALLPLPQAGVCFVAMLALGYVVELLVTRRRELTGAPTRKDPDA